MYMACVLVSVCSGIFELLAILAIRSGGYLQIFLSCVDV